MNLFIPEIGTLLTLNKEWSFTLYPEYRNQKLGKVLGVYKEKQTPNGPSFRWFDGDKELAHHNAQEYNRDTGEWEWVVTYPLVFVPGTQLRVDRIYIRKGSSEYSSVSFWIKSGPYKGKRFWAKLEDVNTINFNL